MRKSRQNQDDYILGKIRSPTDPICPLCDRPIPHSQQEDHHLIPKSKNGRQTQVLHRVCHRQVHALFTETELAKTYNSPDALLSHPEIQKFVVWVKTKPNDFIPRIKTSQRIK